MRAKRLFLRYLLLYLGKQFIKTHKTKNFMFHDVFHKHPNSKIPKPLSLGRKKTINIWPL